MAGSIFFFHDTIQFIRERHFFFVNGYYVEMRILNAVSIVAFWTSDFFKRVLVKKFFLFPNVFGRNETKYGRKMRVLEVRMESIWKIVHRKKKKMRMEKKKNILKTHEKWQLLSLCMFSFFSHTLFSSNTYIHSLFLSLDLFLHIAQLSLIKITHHRHSHNSCDT